MQMFVHPNPVKVSTYWIDNIKVEEIVPVRQSNEGSNTAPAIVCFIVSNFNCLFLEVFHIAIL